MVEKNSRQRIAPVHVAHNSGNNEWYTPPDIIEAARRCMGGIDLDPASCEVAQQTVRAGTYYTIEDDGLCHRWRGRVWLNPPYSSDKIGKFIGKLLAGEAEQACVLVNNATETSWGQALLLAANAVVFLAGRVRFLSPTGAHGAPLQGQMVVGWNVDQTAFSEAFGDLGAVVFPTPMSGHLLGPLFGESAVA